MFKDLHLLEVPGGEGDYVGTEDCLYLDISAPKKKIRITSSNVLDSWWW